MKTIHSLCCMILVLSVPMMFYSCIDDDVEKDRVETITIFVGPDLVDYYPQEGIMIASRGIKIREESSNQWFTEYVSFIEGFEFEEGYTYKLQVIKTSFASYPMDGSSYSYQLIKVISKEKE